MSQSAAEHGGDSNQRFVMGGSADGNLAAAIAFEYSTNANFRPGSFCAFVPGTSHPEVLADKRAGRYIPEMYADVLMLGNDLLMQAWGRHVGS